MNKLHISKEEIDIFTDGSCSGNPGPGGWAGVIIHDLISILTGYETNTTNNRMELMATINIIKFIDLSINETNSMILVNSNYISDNVIAYFDRGIFVDALIRINL